MEIKIDIENDDVRLDRFLRKRYKDMPLSSIYRIIRSGDVKVNGSKKKQDYRLKDGDVVRVPDTEDETKEKVTNFLNLTTEQKEFLKKIVIFENSSIIVVDKPDGMVMHKGSGYDYGLSEMYKSYLKNEEFAFANRIDRDTAGLIIGGKTPSAARELAQIIRDRDISKNYYAIVKGVPKDKYFSRKSLLYKAEDKVIEVKETREGAKESETNFRLVESKNGYSLIEAELITGRTHQIRVHLAALGLPIVGDVRYGTREVKRMYLYSHMIIIPEKEIDVDMDVPEYFREFMNKQGNK